MLLFKHPQLYKVRQKYEKVPKQMAGFDRTLANFLAWVDISFHV